LSWGRVNKNKEMNGREQGSVKERRSRRRRRRRRHRKKERKKEQQSPQNLGLRSITKQNESFTNVQKNITFINYLIW
jgi:hypothetical protein